MAASDTAKLIASLELKDAFSKPLGNISKSLNNFGIQVDRTQGKANQFGQHIGIGIHNAAKLAAVGVGILTSQVIVGLNQLAKLDEITAQTNAGLLSTKSASGQTADSIRKLAEKYENLNAVIDDKVIQSGENVLLTFTRINKEAFEPALAAALDLSVAMGQDLQSSIVQVGKALNDPAKGFTALRRVGIQFTADQEKQIKALQESGDLLGAQKIILAELGTEFGGRFAAQGRSATGTIAGIGDAVEDLQKGLATALFPTVKRLLPLIRDGIASPQFAATISRVGDAIAGLFSDANIEQGSQALTSLFNTAKAVAPAIQSAAEITGRVVSQAVNLFKSLPPEIQALAVAGLAVNKLTGGLVTNIAGGLVDALGKARGATPANPLFVADVTGGKGVLPGVAAGGASILATIAAPLAAALAVGVTAKLQQDNVDQQSSALKLQTLAFTKTATDAQLAASIEGIRKTLAGLGEGPTSNPFNVKGQTTEVLNLLITELNQRTRGGHVINQFGGVGKVPYGPPSRGMNAQGGVGNQPYGPWMTMTDALKSNTSALNKATHTYSDVKAEISADRSARGLTGPFKRSTSLDPRFAFLRGVAAGSKDVSVANAIATGFERGATPLFRNTKLIPKSIKELQRDQAQLLRHGDTRNAALIGKDIDRMKAELARRQGATTKAIQAKNLVVTATTAIATTISNFMNGRLLSANTVRYSSEYNIGGRGPR